MENDLSPIQRACRACGSASALARAIHKTPQFVSQLVAGKQVPADLCPLIEKATRDEGGEIVTCEELRPDVAWAVVRENDLKAAA